MSVLALAAGAGTASAFHNGGAAPGSELNSSEANFESSISVDGNDVTVTISAFGVSPDLPHAQHLHIPDSGAATCPTPAADANGDGVVDSAEGGPSYGPVRVSLTTSGDTTAASGLALDRFPVANADGEYVYTRTFTVDPAIAAAIPRAAIVVHGDDLNGNGTYDGDAPSSLDPNVPLEATIPVACGAVETQYFEASSNGTALNESGTEFDGTVQVDGTNVTVTLMVTGAAAELPHAQHIHMELGTRSACPTLAEHDVNSDGIITVLEGVPAYGGIQASLTTTGDTSPDSGLAIDRFPVADASGAYTYVRTFEVTPEVADNIANGAIVVHGVDENSNGTYDGPPSTLDPSFPQEATLPAACGLIDPISFTASASGDTLNESEAWFDSAVDLVGNELTVHINAYGMSPNLPHAQHIHLELGTKSTCPTLAEHDTNGDGIITVVEGVPAYGGIQLSLTTSGDSSASSGLAVDRFPVADAGGQYTYERTFTISDELAANVTNAAIVLHGDDRNDNGSYDGDAPSSIDPSLPLEATIPVACGVVTLQNTFTSVNPARILDTRDGRGTGSATPIGPDATIDLQVAGEGGVPSTGVVAVAMNLTSTLADSRSFITAYPTGTARPTTSNLNVAPGIDTPNQVIVGLGSDGKVSLYNEAGNGHLVADVTGYFLGGSGLEPVTPARLLDTRNDIGVTTGIVGPDSTISFDATGLAGVPAEGVDSVVLNVTATGPSEPGWGTVYPGGSPRPNTSTVNLDPALDTPNMAIVKVGDNGMIDLYNFIGQSHYVVDVFGYFPDEASFTGLNPSRILDTRDGSGAPAAKVGADGTIEIDVTGVGGVPADGVGTVVLNITATGATEPSWVTAWPGNSARPEASSLNIYPDFDTPNTVLLKVGPEGTVNLYNFRGSTHLIADVMGYFPR